MIWIFERTNQRLRCEIRRESSGSGDELIVTHPDGSPRGVPGRSPPMRLRDLNVGCYGGGTGLPSLLGGLKMNPWLRLHAVVTMFDSGGSSGPLRDELGVLPPGDVLRCALVPLRQLGE